MNDSFVIADRTRSLPAVPNGSKKGRGGEGGRHELILQHGRQYTARYQHLHRQSDSQPPARRRRPHVPR